MSPMRQSLTGPLWQEESLRRIAWSVFFADTFQDRGIFSLHSLSDGHMLLRLPCSEADFARGSIAAPTPYLLDEYAEEGEVVGQEGSIGLSAYIIQIGAIRRRLLHFASILRPRRITNLSVLSRLADLESQLVSWTSNLPEDCKYTEDQMYTQRERSIALFSMHCLHHVSYIILNRAKLLLAISASVTTIDVPQCRQARIAQAFQIANITSTVLKLIPARFDSATAIIAYVAFESARRFTLDKIFPKGQFADH